MISELYPTQRGVPDSNERSSLALTIRLQVYRLNASIKNCIYQAVYTFNKLVIYSFIMTIEIRPNEISVWAKRLGQ